MNLALEERFEWFSKLSQLGERAYEIYRPPLCSSPVYSCVELWLLSLVGCFGLHCRATKTKACKERFKLVDAYKSQLKSAVRVPNRYTAL